MLTDTTWARFRDNPINTFKEFEKDKITVSFKQGYVLEIRIKDLIKVDEGQHRCDICDSIRAVMPVVSDEMGALHACEVCRNEFGIRNI